MPAPPVTVATRPRRRAYSDIPLELRLYFEQNGLRPSWQREQEISMLYNEGIEAVHYELLPEEIRTSLDRLHMPHNADGLFARSTLVLCTQPLHHYEAAEAEYQAMAIARQQRTDVDQLDAEVREQLGLGGVHNPPGILHPAGHGYRPGDFVQHTAPPPDDK